MSMKKDKRHGYRIFTKDCWWDFDGPRYLLGQCVSKEAISTKFMFFFLYEN